MKHSMEKMDSHHVDRKYANGNNSRWKKTVVYEPGDCFDEEAPWRMGHGWSFDEKGTVDAEGQSGDRCVCP